ncbi:MAG: dTMP kinase [Candidatus Carbobacillus altaicus]|nr:dTMP kinase [Candidatus Carbobacillus altaicus]
MQKKLIAFEGVEGSGKSELVARLTAWLKNCGHNVLNTREPGGSVLAERLRQVILDDAMHGLDPLAEAFMYAAARRQHVVETIQPALANGFWVLVDRYIDSSLVYQGMVRGAGLETVEAINRLAVGDLWPGTTILLDLAPELALSRLKALPERVKNRFDREAFHFHEQIRAAYRTLALSEPKRFVIVDASLSPDALFALVRDRLLARYPELA